MLQVNSILFPTDGSPCAEYAQAHAAFLADQFAADLHMLHVVEADIGSLSDLSNIVDLDEREILEQLRLPVPEAVEAPSEERVHRVKRTDESAAQGILDYAADEDIDLIVMGTHGRRGMGRLLMGSVAEEVVRMSESPTLTVCGPDRPTPTRDINRVLVPMGLSEHTGTLFDHARAIGATYGAELELIHIVERSPFPPVYGVDADPASDTAVTDRVHEALEEYAASAHELGVETRITVRRGHPAEVILERIETAPIDLVTIATHGRSGLRRLLIGSVAEKVVRMASCPVFTVKSFGKSLVDASAAGPATASH